MNISLSGISEGLRPDPNITFLDWANEFFCLPRESTAEYGQYRSDRTPMVEEILLELSPNSRTQEVVVMKPTQLAGTTAALILMLASIDISPAPGLLIEPTGDLARSFSKKKFQTAIDSTIAGSGRLKGKIADVKSRDSKNTILEKTFPGGSWRLAGSNSPAVYRGESVRYLILDDFDGFDPNIGGEGDPGELADRRTGTFPNRKIYKNSTPTLRGLSNIERAYENSSQGKFHVPCPHCGEFQYLIFRQVKFTRDSENQITDCWYECDLCAQRIDEHQKAWMLPRGKYIHKYTEREIRGFHYNALYTPVGWINTWKRIAESFLKSKDNVEKLQVWTNTLMAEPFEAKGSQPDWSVLMARCEPYRPLEVPQGGYLLTSGIDVHQSRLNVVIRAWGTGEENWLIYACELFGDIQQDEVWDQLDTLLNRPYKHASGVDLHVISAGVDSGDFAQRVYQYCRTRGPKVFALKGQSQPGKPIIGRPTHQDVTYKGTVLKNGIQLWPAGVDTAKKTFYGRLQLTEPGPGFYHFYVGIADDYFQQITSEKLITKYQNGFPKSAWTMMRANHFLDAEIYCYAAAIKAGLPRINFDEIELKAKHNKSELQSAQIQKPKVKNQKSKPMVARSNWMSR